MKKGKEVGLLNSRAAQATIFIIIAIILVCAIVIVFFTLKKSNPTDNFSNDLVVQSKFIEIKTSIYDCMKFTSQNSLDVIGYQGGYYKMPLESLDFGWIAIPYYYSSGNFLMPTNTEIENQLSMYVNDNFKLCIEGINTSDFNIILGEIDTQTHIKEQEVEFNIDLPVTIKKGESFATLELKSDPVILDSKLYDILDVARFITESHRKDPNNLCISCIDSLAKEKKVFVEISEAKIDNSTNLIILSENVTTPDFYIFEFLNKYSTNSS